MNKKENLSLELEKAMAEAEILEQVNTRVRRKTSWILLLVSFLCLVMVTFSWFTISTLANVQRLEMEIGTAPDLRISTENHGSNWDQYIKTVTGAMIDKQLTDRFNTTMDDQILDPVTSSNGRAFSWQSGREAERNKNSFLEFDLYLIANKDLSVKLTSRGEENGTNGIKGSSVSTTETGGKADVVRAVRISFTNEAGQTIIWEPNKGTAVAGQSTFDFSNSANTSPSEVCSLKKLEPQKVTVRLWFEGEDPECVNRIEEAAMSAILTFGGDQN